VSVSANTPTPPRPLRLLIVLPSWVGDVVMATPVLRRIRSALPGAFIGGLCRPGIDQLLAGSDLLDELHVERASGVMGPKFVAAKIRPRRYDTALLLTNSFSTALTVRIAGIPRRIGYDRDSRGILLTDRLAAPTREIGSGGATSLLAHAFTRAKFDLTPACTYYWRAADSLLGEDSVIPDPFAWPVPASDRGKPVCMELATTPAEEAEADRILSSLGGVGGAGGTGGATRFVVLNPGGNNEAKRWPAERFGALAAWLAGGGAGQQFGIAINGSPGERELCARIASMSGVPALILPDHGITLGALKAVVKRASLMVTNDTGPRHIAAAFGVPVVSLFGPTDHRWTVIPTKPGSREAVVVADPTLEAGQLANDHPERCRIDRIDEERVRRAVQEVLR
jgi:heptosyltransferase-2